MPVEHTDAYNPRPLEVVNSVGVLYTSALWNKFDIGAVSKDIIKNNKTTKFPGIILNLRNIRKLVQEITPQIPTNRPLSIEQMKVYVPTITSTLFCSEPPNNLLKRARRRKKRREPPGLQGDCGKNSAKAIIPGPRSAEQLAVTVFLLMTNIIGPNVDMEVNQ